MTIAIPLAMACVLTAAAGCGGDNNTGATPQFSTVVNPTATPPGGTSTPGAPPTSAAPASDWPSPEDCVSYNPGNVTKVYEAGRISILDGNKVVMLVSVDGPTDTLPGDQALALAKRFKKHCYIGRKNNRQEHNNFVFDYWRDPSGNKPSIPDLDEICTEYERDELVVEDMGGGDGWRVKYGDNPLQHFDNGNDARNGKLVLAKTSRLCYIGQGSDEDDPEVITFAP